MTEQQQAPSKCYRQLRALLAASDDNGTKYKQDSAAAFIVGAGPEAREAVPALHALGLAPIFILHYDSGEMYNLLNDFLHIDLRGLRTPGMAQRELDDLAERKIQVVVGVCTIPSTPPTTPREEYVYKISELLLQQPYQATPSEDRHLRMPAKRQLADMHNGPGALYMQKEAEDQGWGVSAIEASFIDVKESGPASGTASDESPYWWQFMQKVTAAEA